MPTEIQWTDETWNPVTGCSHVSPGCEHCYAEALSLRFGFSKKPWTAQNAAENVVLHPERLEQPLRWRQPRRVFVNSMSDLFHDRVPQSFIADVFAVMAAVKDHTFQILTKRPERMRDLMDDPGFVDLADSALQGWAMERGWCLDEIEGWPLPNVWLGASVEDQRRADERIPYLIDTPAAVRFLSVEPMLGPVDLSPWLATEIKAPFHWVIVGGESGPKHRPFDADWARSLRDQCQAAGVAYFFKQHGGRTPKAGGRLLDGCEWSEFPEVRA